MFQLSDKRTVSDFINSAREAILKSFVLYNLGFGQVSHQDIIDLYTTTISRELMCSSSADTTIIVIDGTYIYIQLRHDLKYSKVERF